MVFIDYKDWETKPIRSKIKYFIGMYITGQINGTLPPIPEQKNRGLDGKNSQLEKRFNCDSEDFVYKGPRPNLVAKMREDDLRHARGVSSGLKKVVRY